MIDNKNYALKSGRNRSSINFKKIKSFEILIYTMF